MSRKFLLILPEARFPSSARPKILWRGDTAEMLDIIRRRQTMNKMAIMTVIISVICCVVAAEVAKAQTNAASTNTPPRSGRGGFGGGISGGNARGPAVPAITTNTPGMPGVPMPDPALGSKGDQTVGFFRAMVCVA